MENRHNYKLEIKTNRTWYVVLLLNWITCGIYGIYFYYTIGEDINVMARKHDGKKTMNYVLAFLLSIITCGIFAFIWMHGVSDRIGNEIRRRRIDYKFSAETFWLFSVLPTVILMIPLFIITFNNPDNWGFRILIQIAMAIGPAYYLHKLCNAMNLLAHDFNRGID